MLEIETILLLLHFLLQRKYLPRSAIPVLVSPEMTSTRWTKAGKRAAYISSIKVIVKNSGRHAVDIVSMLKLRYGSYVFPKTIFLDSVI